MIINCLVFFYFLCLDFSADNETSARKVHDDVSCIVRSNLETRYNWKIEQNGQYVFLNSNRTIVVQNPGIYRCYVEYSIGQNTCSLLTSIVNASVVTGSSGFQKEQGNVQNTLYYRLTRSIGNVSHFERNNTD